MNEIEELMGKDLNPLEEYKLLIRTSKVEKCKAEKIVLSMLIEGLTPKEIAIKMSNIYPQYYWGWSDIEQFMLRHKDVITIIENKRVDLAVSHLSARESCEHKMAELITFTEDLMKECKRNGDIGGSIAAINALNRSYQNYMKIRGFSNETHQTAKNIINIISDEKSRLKDRILSTNFNSQENTIDIKPTNETVNG